MRRQCLGLELFLNGTDEHTIKITGSVVAEQFVRNKPNFEGIKVFVCCSVDGVVRDFSLYQGEGTGVSVDNYNVRACWFRSDAPSGVPSPWAKFYVLQGQLLFVCSSLPRV